MSQLLQIDASKRPNVRGILGHRWFTHPHPLSELNRPKDMDPTPFELLSSRSPEPLTSSDRIPIPPPSDTATSDTDHTGTVSLSSSSAPSSLLDVPDDSIKEEGESIEKPFTSLRHNPSQTTIRNVALHKPNAALPAIPSPLTEEPALMTMSASPSSYIAPQQRSTSLSRTDSMKSTATSEPPYPSRTPVRTKRRSIPIALSPPLSPDLPPSTAGPMMEAVTTATAVQEKETPPTADDFLMLLTTSSPLVFSTPLERELLEDLSKLGFDTAQMCHSVMTDACDAAGAVWWMLLSKRKRAKEKEEAAAANDHTEVKTSASQRKRSGSKSSPLPRLPSGDPEFIELDLSHVSERLRDRRGE